MVRKIGGTDAFKVGVAFWLAALFWGTSFLWIKLGLEGWNPVSLVAFRLLIGSIFFAAALLLTGTRIRLDRKNFALVFLIAVLNPYVPFLLISWAEQSVETGMTSILNATVPLFTLVIAVFFLPNERPTWRTFWGTLIGFMGIAVLFGGQIGEVAVSPGSSLIGKLAVLLATLCYAMGGILVRRRDLGLPPLALAALLNLFACICVWVQALATGQLVFPPAQINGLAILWLGAFGSFAAYSCMMYVMLKRGAMHAALINFAYPLLGLLLGIVFLGEPFQWRLVIGAVLILGGILTVQRRV